jgi:hypothetical protein
MKNRTQVRFFYVWISQRIFELRMLAGIQGLHL